MAKLLLLIITAALFTGCVGSADILKNETHESYKKAKNCKRK